MARRERNLPVGPKVDSVQELTDAPVGAEVIFQPNPYSSMSATDLTYVKEPHGWRGTNARNPQTGVRDTGFERGIAAGLLHWTPANWTPRA